MKLTTAAVLAGNVALWARPAPAGPRLVAALALAVLAGAHIARLIRRRSA